VKRYIIFLVIFLLSLSLGSTSRKNLLFQVEYTKAVDNVQSLQILFFSKTTPQRAESMLRDFMILTIKYSPPTVEIVGFMWDSRDRVEGDEKMIHFPNGKSTLVYSPKTKKFSYL